MAPQRTAIAALLVLLAVATLAACGDTFEPLVSKPDKLSRTPPPDTLARDSMSPVASVTLVAPLDGAEVGQNDSTLACEAHQFRGRGFAIHFDWDDTDPELGVAGYHLYVKHQTSVYPLINTVLDMSELAAVYCNSFVIDRNALDWYWFVQALDDWGNIMAESGVRWFSFAPCRLPNGNPCSAPGSAPALPIGVRFFKASG
jgi:predicted small lipoprotein YifL